MARLLMSDAMERAEIRLTMAGMICGPGERVPLQSSFFTCSGTDVAGPELAERIQLDMRELADEWADVEHELEQLPALVRGLLLRSFWVGYEYGVVADV